MAVDKPEPLDNDAVERLIVHYTAPDEGHSTPLQRQTLAAMLELREHRKCIHGIPRKHCTGVH